MLPIQANFSSIQSNFLILVYLELTPGNKFFFSSSDLATIPANITASLLNIVWKILMFLSYRNQSIDLLCKSIDWFLYRETLVVKGLKIIVL